MMDDIGEQAMIEAIPIPNVGFPNSFKPSHETNSPSKVNEAVLNKVIEWCVHHKGDPPATNDDDADSRKKTTDIEEWDQKFMQVDQEMLFEIILVGSLPRVLLLVRLKHRSRLPTTLISKLSLMSAVRPSPI